MTTRKQEALFRPPAIDLPPLSAAFATPSYRASVDEMPKWAAVKLRNPVPCDECFALQHETRGEYGTRYNAKHRRVFKGGPILLLCSQHMMVWKAKDDQDAGVL